MKTRRKLEFLDGSILSNLANGQAQGSLVSIGIEGRENVAPGRSSVALGKRSKAYQDTGIALGGECQAGLSEEDFEAYYGIDTIITGVSSRIPRLLSYASGIVKYFRTSGTDGYGTLIWYGTDVETYSVYYKIVDGKIKRLADDKSEWLDIEFIDNDGRTYETSNSLAFSAGSSNKSLGKYSVTLGDQNKAEGRASVMLGVGNYSEIAGEASIACGYANTNSASYCSTFGGNNKNAGAYTLVAGADNNVQPGISSALVVGRGLRTGTSANDTLKVLLGQYNALPSKDDILIIGNGKASNQVSNLLEIKKDKIFFRGEELVIGSYPRTSLFSDGSKSALVFCSSDDENSLFLNYSPTTAKVYFETFDSLPKGGIVAPEGEFTRLKCSSKPTSDTDVLRAGDITFSDGVLTIRC